MSSMAAIFPGQGSQILGMGRDVAEVSSTAHETFKQADQILGFELSRICFEGPESELTRTDVQQPAILVTSIAIWRALEELGGDFASLFGASAGLSLGEYTALHVAGSLTFEDAVRLVRRRGEFMQEAAESTGGAMVSIIGSDEPTVTALCSEAAEGDVLVPANFNAPGQIVISGSQVACDRALEAAEKHGVRGIRLKVAGAFHSPLMADAAERLGKVLAETEIQSPRFPVYANVTAKPHGDPDEIKWALEQQVTGAVRWQQSIQSLIDSGLDQFVEIGPGRVLTGLMRKIDRKAKAINISSRDQLDIDVLSSAVA